MDADGKTLYSISAPTFYSNAEYAVRNIKQEKATPEQWLKMIEKNGGLKVGEDKWLGLSDWLKASTAKTLTKDEVLQYIVENNTMHSVDVNDAMRESVMQGQPRFSLAYHGSGADFDKFDHSFMSSGEGQQVFGWGTYVSEVEDIAKSYAEESGRPNNIDYHISALKSRISAIKQNIELLNKRIVVYASDAEYVERLNAQKTELEKEIVEAESEISRLEKMDVVKGKILYTVDIPDNNGDNYIEYDKSVSEGVKRKVYKALDEYNEVFIDDMREALGIDEKMSDQEVLGLLRSNISMLNGWDMYKDMSRELGGDKEASIFLADAGIAGISYPAEATTGGRADNARNYVIFNADDVKIIDKTRYSLSDISAYEASAELSVVLDAYKSNQIALNMVVKAVENIIRKYSKTDLLKFVLEEYEDGKAGNEDLIYALKGFISIYPPKVLRDYSGNKITTREKFGGIWIEDTQEFAKFVSAVNNTPFEEDGEGIAYTDNYFYAYYRNIDGQPVPYASVYLNRGESQNIVAIILKAKRNEEKKGVRRYFDRAYERARHISGENDGNLSSNKKLPYSRRNDRLDSELPRYGAYYDSPELFVKSKRTYKGSKVNYSLITPEMDADYLSAVERGDMDTASKMVEEDAILEGQRDAKVGAIVDELQKTRFSLQSDVADILNRYDEGIDLSHLGSIEDVADAIETLIAESVEDTTELENILADFRAAQDDARKWGNRMDAGGEEDFEMALREYANKTTLGERSDADSHNSSSEGLPSKGSERLSGNALTPPKDVAKIAKATEATKRSVTKILNEGGIKSEVSTPAQAVSALGKGLHMEKSDSSQSYYGDFFEGDYLVDGKVVHLRISTHPAIGDRMGNADADHKVSLVVRKNGEHYSRDAHNGYEEIVYEPSEITPRDAANAIVNGVKSLIETGEYVDITGKAHRSTYPIITPDGKTLYSLITPQMDADYLSAVERGDMEMAQKMVNTNYWHTQHGY